MIDKIIFKNSRGLKLVGVMHTPIEASRSAVIMAHGFTGDKDESGKFIRAAEEFCNSGFAVLRFDFAGSGDNGEIAITIEGQVDDLRSAIGHVRALGYDVGLLGYSLGGLCSLMAYDLAIKTIVLWAPATEPRVPPRLQTGEAKLEFETKGYKTIKNRAGRRFKIDARFVKQMQDIKKKEILSRIGCPVLIIHGNEDEVAPIDHSKNALRYLSSDSKLEIINSANHDFETKLVEVIDLSLRWFKRYLTV